MSLTPAETTHPAIRSAMPPIHLSADLLDSVQAAMPPPPADAPLAWQHPSRPQLIATIAAYHPCDVLQARLAAQIVTVRLVAEDTRWRSSAPALPVQLASSLRRTAGRRMRTAALLEHTLRQRQKSAAREHGAPATDALDLAALTALGGQDPRIDRPRSNPMQRENAPEATPAPTRAVRAVPWIRVGGAIPKRDASGRFAPGAAA